MNKYSMINLIVCILCLLAFAGMGDCYFRFPMLPYFTGPFMFDSTHFYTDATPGTLHSAIDVNFSSSPYVSISQSYTGGYDLAPATAPMGQQYLLDVCMRDDLDSVVCSYMDTFGSLIVAKEISGDNTFYEVYAGLPKGFPGMTSGSTLSQQFFGAPVMSSALPLIPFTGFGPVLPAGLQLPGQGQSTVLPNVIVPSPFDFLNLLEQILVGQMFNPTQNPLSSSAQDGAGARSAQWGFPGSLLTNNAPLIPTPFMGLNWPIGLGSFVPYAMPIQGPGFGFW